MPRATLRLLTPTRLAEKGGLTRQPGFDVVVRSLLMRGLAMRHVHGGADVDFDISGLVERARTATTVGSDLRLHRLNRRSSRQKALVPLDGMVGTITFEGEAVAELWPLLLAGELLHLGKGTAFRCGRYVIERGDSAAARPETGDA